MISVVKTLVAAAIATAFALPVAAQEAPSSLEACPPSRPQRNPAIRHW